MSTINPWWRWHWDRRESRDVPVKYASVTRWRRGSLLTVYRMQFASGGVQWWFYGPFNLCVCVGRGG